MSWDEQKWTVDQIGSNVQTKLNTLRTNVKNDVNASFESTDSGKDLYMSGIPRGSKGLSLNTTLGSTTNQSEKVLLDVTGSGWVTEFIVENNQGATNTNTPTECTGTVVIDNTQTIIGKATLTYGGSIASRKVTISTGSTSRTVDRNRGSDISVTNADYSYNMPFRFNNRLVVKGLFRSTANNGNYFRITCNYTLDSGGA